MCQQDYPILMVSFLLFHPGYVLKGLNIYVKRFIFLHFAHKKFLTSKLKGSGFPSALYCVAFKSLFRS